jgi:hypothetical protein
VTQLATLRQGLQVAQDALRHEEQQLALLQAARERARDEWRTASGAVDAAEATVAKVRQFDRTQRVTAYINREPLSGATLVEAQAELDRRTTVLRDTEATERALREEAGVIEASLRQYRYQHDAAIGALFSASPEFLALYQRQAELWVELRSLRLAMLAVGSAIGGPGLENRLLSLAQVSEPIDDRRTGYVVDEALVSRWTTAVAQLRGDATASLPGAVLSPAVSPPEPTVSTPEPADSTTGAAVGGSPGSPSLETRSPPVRRGGPQHPPPSRRRAGRRGASLHHVRLARERDPATGKWRKKATAPGEAPPPE